MSLRPIDLRILAGLLAIGGTSWGILLFPWIRDSERLPQAILLFGPGYVVTLAYYIRVLTLPPLLGRQCIWWLSFLVQGGWLAWHLIANLCSAGPLIRLTEPHRPVGWWCFATAASVVALILEQEDSAGSKLDRADA